MDWSSMFSPVLLAQGKTFYAAGRVKDMIDEPDGYYITVADGHNYYVTAMLTDNRLLGLGCTCQESESGGHCKHEAAALYALENRIGRIVLPDPGRETDLYGKEAEEDKEGGEDAFSPVSDLSLSAIEELRMAELEERIPEGAGSKIIEDYRYFREEEFVRGLHLSKEVLDDANHLIKSRAYKPIRVNLYYKNEEDGEDLVGEAVLDSPDSDFRKWQASIRFDSDHITDSYCSSMACHYRYDRESYLERTLCRHQVAAILLTQKYLRDNNTGDATNSAGMKLLGLLRGPETAFDEGEGSGGPVAKGPQELTIEPYLTLDKDMKVYASFRIGAGRLYKIQNIPETVKDIRLHRERAFGAKTVLALGREYIGKDSLPWLSFLEGVADEEELKSNDYELKYRDRISSAEEGNQKANRYLDARKLLELTDTIPLYGEKLDSFFDIAGDMERPIELTKKTGKDKEKTQISFLTANPRLIFEIHKDVDEKREIFRGIMLSGRCPRMIWGRERAYYIEGDNFCAVEPHVMRELRPVFEVSQDGFAKIRIGRSHLRYFYSQVLPKLRKYIDIIEYDADEIASYLPPKAEFVTYLDVEDGMVIGRSEVWYGDQVHPVTDVYGEERGELRLASYRDRDAEWQLADLMKRYLPQCSEEDHIYYCDKKEDAVYDFLNEGLSQVLALSEVHMTERFQRLKLRRRLPFRMDVSVGSNLMDLRLSSDELSKEELIEILNRYRKKKRFVKLHNGDYFKIDENESVEALSLLMSSMEITPREFVEGKMHIPAYRALYLDKMVESAADLSLDRDEHFKELIRDFKTVEDADFEIPPSLREILRKYQKKGYRWLRTLDLNAFGGILADDMGLGKTLQAIAVLLADKLYNMERSDERPETSLVVCPASLVYNWEEELGRFAPCLITRTLTGPRQDREKQIEDYKDVDVLITSYDLMRRDIDLYEDHLFRFLIADEAQYIKNPRTAAARSIKLIKASTRFALTGTPIENRLSELWSIFDFLMPGFLYDYPTFRDNFEIPVTRYHDEEAAAMLKRMVTPFILRRMKEEVLADLPEKMEDKLYVRMGQEQQQLYDSQVSQLLDILHSQTREEYAKSKIRILADLMRLRQICCDPSLCFEDYEGGSAKKEACMELIRGLSDGDHKALVFSQFTSMLDILEKELEAEGIGYYKITGSTPKAMRLQLVHAFNEDDTPVFLISLKAGGTGLNLTGADVVIHYDPWWNTAAQNQATDRSYRIGQTRPVNVYRLIAKGSIEDRILELQRSKQNLSDVVMAAEETGTTMLDREDLLKLLECRCQRRV